MNCLGVVLVGDALREVCFSILNPTFFWARRKGNDADLLVEIEEIMQEGPRSQKAGSPGSFGGQFNSSS